MSAPETVTIEELFAAHDNSVAVLRVRYYLDQLALLMKRCVQCPDRSCVACVVRGRITADIRALLPAVDAKT